MKIRPVGAELCQVDRRTDRHDVPNIRLSQFYQSAYTRTGAMRTICWHPVVTDWGWGRPGGILW